MNSFKIDSDNKMFSIAAELVNYSNRNIFLTGKAGTGKTTFLKYIREQSHKQLAVVAPTGVAAINAGGVTIHSFFQLPVSPFIPSSGGFNNTDDTVNKHSLLSRLRMNKEKRKILQELELLIIDEISMVRCDTLDAVDTVLKYIRNRPNEAFGGVQVLFIGDMYQLPPVIKDVEWQMLSEYYRGPYFFDSLVMQQDPPVYIEFEKIYRQREEQFIKILNQVRNNALDESGVELLENRYEPDFKRKKNDGYIILTTHNETARQINMEQLADLKGSVFTFRAQIEEDFPANAFPADEILQLKVGAQVMFIKNDLERSKRFFNGKLGIVTQLDDENITVQCEGESGEIEVAKEKWENIRYDLNKNTRQLEETRLGSFSQFPLRLAWAITIHKSQGLTFEKAIIDAGKSFAAGQVYVALSRCTSLDGMVLNSKINPYNLKTDHRIINFSRQSGSLEALQEELSNSRKSYWQKILITLFDFSPVIANGHELTSYVNENKSSFNENTVSWLEDVQEKLNIQQGVAERFQQQLTQLFANDEMNAISQRVKAARAHFFNELHKLTDFLQHSPAETDSRLHAKEYNEWIKEMITQLLFRQHMFSESETFDLSFYLEKKKRFVVPAIAVNAYAGASTKSYTDIPNPKLYNLLRKKRDEISNRKQIPIYLVAGSTTLVEMSTYLPQTLEELHDINGFGPVKIDQYGQVFLDIIINYSAENDLSSRMDEKPATKQRKEKTGTKKKKGDTQTTSFELFQQGKTIAEIAEERKLAVSTIETHLSKYISSGEIAVENIVPLEKIKNIKAIINKTENTTITQLKQQLGNDFSYGEIRMVLASMSNLPAVE